MSCLRFLLLTTVLLLASGCDQLPIGQNASNPLGNRPEIDCLITNDFYAVHFSAYVQPSKEEMSKRDKMAFVPYCQKIPRSGKMFFSADLIDRDIRSTPIGIKIVEVEKTGQPAPNEFKEIRTVTEIPANLYPRGVVEAQADIDKLGDYVLYLMIGDAMMEDDQFKIPLEIGADPNALTPKQWAMIAGGILSFLVLAFMLYFYLIKRKKA